ncbi:argininosuccinate lyase [Membranihabitans marinus]|uniref:argininosuccinate lyase n=1 Tax=Membranihabitans marinus TaxID=1227546 RepID=UPI001F02D833|nr:argininosuccinate lyase [Membranihabitans marinus]
MSKLWANAGNKINKQIEDFTIGKDAELDLTIAKHDVLGSMAHAIMLYESDIVSKEDLQSILKGLHTIYEKIVAGQFAIESGIEDVHSQVEMELTKMIGEAGKKLHTARSRNDQVLVDLKMYYRDYLTQIISDLEVLIKEFLKASEKYKSLLMPGYTHLQVAMPSSFGLWLGGYGECLIADIMQLKSLVEVVNLNPLGSAAGYGSSFPIQRKRTTELLGFRDLEYNVIGASMNRGKTEFLLANAISSISLTLGKFCMDVCLYNSQNYGFLTLPSEYTTGSSIMPHKKNPDVFELLRAKFNGMLALPHEISSVLQNLPTGYHRDYQLLKEIIFPKLTSFSDCLQILTFVIDKIEVAEDLMTNPLYAQAFSVDLIKEKVDGGMAFRDAYLLVKEELAGGMDHIPEINHSHEGSIGQLNTEEILQKLSRTMDAFPAFDFTPFENRLKNFQV